MIQVEIKRERGRGREKEYGTRPPSPTMNKKKTTFYKLHLMSHVQSYNNDNFCHAKIRSVDLHLGPNEN